MVSRTEGNIDDSLIGGNASAEGPEGEGTESTVVTGVDIVMNHHLQETASQKRPTKTGCGWLPERYPPSARSANIPTDSTNKLRKAGAVSTQPHGTFLARRTEIDVSCLGPKQPYLNQHCPFLGSEKTPLPPSDVSAPLN
ncbi:Mss4-like containing protein [Cricetulus griseus]|nr:Mss4-like containing protein [Cricetulus griseus]